MQQYRPAYKALRIQFSAALQLLTTNSIDQADNSTRGWPRNSRRSAAHESGWIHGEPNTYPGSVIASDEAALYGCAKLQHWKHLGARGSSETTLVAYVIKVQPLRNGRLRI